MNEVLKLQETKIGSCVAPQPGEEEASHVATVMTSIITAVL